MANTTETKTTPKAPKKVTLKFPRSRKEEGDEWASVNGEKYLIKRGENVEVPAYIAEVYEHREEMLEIAMEYEAQAAQNAEQK